MMNRFPGYRSAVKGALHAMIVECIVSAHVRSVPSHDTTFR